MSYYLGADKLQFHSCRKILALMFKCSGNKEGSKSGDKCALALGVCLSAFCPRFASDALPVLLHLALKAAGPGLS